MEGEIRRRRGNANEVFRRFCVYPTRLRKVEGFVFMFSFNLVMYCTVHSIWVGVMENIRSKLSRSKGHEMKDA